MIETLNQTYQLENGDVVTDITGTPFVLIKSGYPVRYDTSDFPMGIDPGRYKTFHPNTIILMPDSKEQYLFTGYSVIKREQPSVDIEGYQWNIPDEEGKPRLSLDIKDRHVRPTSYMEVHALIGTSGCAHSDPMWNWSVLGVIETERGKQVVYPGDWVVTLKGELLGAFSPEKYQALCLGR